MTARRTFLSSGTARARVTAAPEAAFAPRDEQDEADVFLAEELARLVPGLPPEQARAFTWLVRASLAAGAQGSTRLPVAGQEGTRALAAAFERLRAPEGTLPAARRLLTEMAGPSARLAPVVGGPDDYRPLVLDDGCLYHQRMHALEARVAGLLRDRLLAGPPASGGDALIAEVTADPPRVHGRPLRLSKEQRVAVARALDGTLTVISGGPGTGKTSIVVSILRALVRRGDVPVEAIALAAPTGRAADRMRRSVEAALRRLRQPTLADRDLLTECPSARTLHRLLGYSPRTGRFRHHDQNPLAERFVIVDESSMIDLALMDRLLCSLRPDAQLVLLGDADQLPSVEAGAVFRDLCAHAGTSAAPLEKSFRMDPSDPSGRAILTVARAIRAPRPNAPITPIELRVRAGDIAFEAVEQVAPDGPRERDAVWERWWASRLRADADALEAVSRVHALEAGELSSASHVEIERLAAWLERSRILCVTRGAQHSAGAGAVNAWFHARALAEAGRARRAGAAGSAPLLAGEPLLVSRNDYDLGLFNGDLGVVLRVAQGGREGLAAVFRRDPGFVAFPLDAVRPLVDLAYATTVHKAQGSEHDHVALVLPPADHVLLTAEVLYTAVTRARRSVLLIGPAEALAAGAARRMERYSGVGARIAGA